MGEPSPRPGWHPAAPDPRIADAEEREAQTRVFAAELFAIHPTYVHEAEEEIVFLADAFLSHIPEASCNVPRLSIVARHPGLRPRVPLAATHAPAAPVAEASAGRAGAPLRVETPDHLGYLSVLLAEFPDAHIVHSHRDPVAVITSGASLNTTLWRTHCGDDVDPHEVGRQWLERMGWSCDRAMAVRASIPDAQVTDIAFVDAVADPIGTAGTILAAVDLDLTDDSVAAMQAWIEQDRKRESLPVHRYSAEAFGLTDDQIEARFAEYRRRFL